MPFDSLPQEKRVEVSDFPPRASFELWLRSHPVDEEIARTCESARCPLAVWLKATVFPNCSVKVYADQVSVLRSDAHADYVHELIGLPLWAQMFVAEIDNPSEFRSCDRVTAGNCLAVLQVNIRSIGDC